MPIAAYSTVLWELPAPNGAGVPVYSPQVPAGFVWVVRAVSAINQFVGQSIGCQQLQFSVDGFVVWATPRNASRMQVPYESGDVRWVAKAGTTLSTFSGDSNWAVRVSGYQLQASA